MIESGIIVYSFILAGIISAICFSIFIWINLKDRDLDEDLYSKKKNIRNIVEKHKHTGEVQDESIDSLSKYSVSNKKEEIEDKKEKEAAQEALAKEGSTIDSENDDLKLVEDDIISDPISNEDYNSQFKPK